MNAEAAEMGNLRSLNLSLPYACILSFVSYFTSRMLRSPKIRIFLKPSVESSSILQEPYISCGQVYSYNFFIWLSGGIYVKGNSLEQIYPYFYWDDFNFWDSRAIFLLL